jgi:uncharacterized membrane protein
MIALKYIFVMLYVIIDIIYITLSAPFYNKTVTKIQGTSIKLKPSAFVALVVAYIILGFGWMFIVADRITVKTKIKDVILIAIIFALSVYGVFNATLYVLFDNWDIQTVIRDTLWGITCITSISLLYWVLIFSGRK